MHSGFSSLRMLGGAVVSQEVPVTEGQYYDLAFSLHGETSAPQLTATVTFLDAGGNTVGTTSTVFVSGLNIPSGDGVFNKYYTITEAAPAGATAALISFTASGSNAQALYLDDVSFSGR